MAGHYAGADVGRLLRQANLIVNRQQTRTVDADQAHAAKDGRM
jgi:hypothetical protein